MIFGIFDADRHCRITADDLKGFGKGGERLLRGNLGLLYVPWDASKAEPAAPWSVLAREKCIGVLEGRIFKAQESRLRAEEKAAETLTGLYRSYGTSCFRRLNGGFAAGIADPGNGLFLLARDPLGIEPLFYSWDGKRLVFGSSLKRVASCLKKSELSPAALYQFLSMNYIPGRESLIAGIEKLKPGHLIAIQSGRLDVRRYWDLSFSPMPDADEENLCRELRRRMEEAVSIRVQEKSARMGAFLSGGMDSSSVVSLMAGKTPGPVHTFSFRCIGKTVDESRYAQIMAERCGTRHHLVEYAPGKVETIGELVRYMDEPFGDLGIEIATFLLAQCAREHADVVLTGDGGDELFAGHPVYFADRMASRFDRIPFFLKKPAAWMGNRLPESEKKASLAVKIKRFSYSVQFPREYYSNRWRMYYTARELAQLVPQGLKTGERHPMDEIAALYAESDATDPLARSLYGDYQTVVQFYLRRMQVLRHFGIEARFPLLDPDLASYAATIPSDLKIRKHQSKYILHKAMAGVLPDEIVFRTDKLGHSVPMKNWMRDEKPVREFIRNTLAGPFRAGSFDFDTRVIARMLSEHEENKRNHSHRLWALVVLKLWLEDRGYPVS